MKKQGSERLHITAHDDLGKEVGAAPVGFGIDSAAPGQPPADSFVNSFADDRQAARLYLARSLGQGVGPAMRNLSPAMAPAGPATVVAPDLQEAGLTDVTVSATKLVSFDQRKHHIPVFGARSVVEIDRDRQFVSASLNVVDVDGVGTTPQLDRQDAAGTLARALNVETDRLPEANLSILPLDDSAPRLTWHFARVPIAPTQETNYDEPGPPPDLQSAVCCDQGLALTTPDYDYFIAADDGTLLYYFSNQRRIDLPTWCRGEDEEHVDRAFYGHADNGAYAMDNRFEEIRTFDLGHSLLETSPLPTTPINSGSNDWGDTNRAGVSAQVNAARVMDFLFSVLRRDSIDDDGMPLESIVNCVSKDVDVADRPEWINAVWWRGRMWYGQRRLAGGDFQSLSRFLDIIAHELFHGVTENTADLVYRDLPGALNESMSDIFGVIINNWYTAPDREDPSTWNWEMGPGLGSGGAPLRNMQDPSSVGRWWRPDPTSPNGWQRVTGYPDHMNQHIVLPDSYDHGGVHIFSNIHNRAGHGVLTSTLLGGGRVFAPQEVAVLYYLALSRLGPLSDFSDARAELLTVADVIYGGSAARATDVRTAIEGAYDAVGIT